MGSWRSVSFSRRSWDAKERTDPHHWSDRHHCNNLSRGILAPSQWAMQMQPPRIHPRPCLVKGQPWAPSWDGLSLLLQTQGAWGELNSLLPHHHPEASLRHSSIPLPALPVHSPEPISIPETAHPPMSPRRWKQKYHPHHGPHLRNRKLSSKVFFFGS